MTSKPKESDNRPLTPPQKGKHLMVEAPATSTDTRNRRLLLGLMLLATFVASLNQTILAPALPSMMRDMGINASQGQWFTTIFLLVNGVMIPITAYLTKRYTVRRLFIISLTFFLLGTTLAGFYADFYAFLLARVLQAIGFGIMMPVLINVTMLMFPGNKRGEAMGYIGIIMTAAPALGPPFSGFIIDNWGWQTTFRILIPLMAVNLLLAILFMKDPDEAGQAHLDIPSVVQSTLGFGLLLYAFSAVGLVGWLHWQTLGSLVLGILFLVTFFRRQNRLTYPLLDMVVFQSRQFRIGTILGMLVNAALIAGSIATPIYLQQVVGYTAFKATLVMLPGSLIGMVLSPFVGRWFDRYGIVWLSRIGYGTMLIGTLSYLTFTTTSSFLYLTFCYTIRIIGINFIMLPVNTWSLNALPNDLIPHGNAMSTTFRQVAGSVGTAAIISIMTIVTQAQSQLGFELATLAGFKAAFGVSALFLAFGLILIFLLVRDEVPDQKEHTRP